MATKYRKKPIVIEAIQFKGVANIAEVDAFMGGRGGFQAWPDRMCVETLEGIMIGLIGDWIIRGIKGEFYPCKDDIFRATYEAVEE